MQSEEENQDSAKMNKIFIDFFSLELDLLSPVTGHRVQNQALLVFRGKGSLLVHCKPFAYCRPIGCAQTISIFMRICIS